MGYQSMDRITEEKVRCSLDKIAVGICDVYQDRLFDLESEYLDDDGYLDEDNGEFIERKESLDDEFDFLLSIDSMFNYKGDIHSQIEAILASADELKINRSDYQKLSAGLHELEKFL